MTEPGAGIASGPSPAPRAPLSGRLELVLARRFLGGGRHGRRGRRDRHGYRARPLVATARAALAATTLGVAALGLAMALMTGYRRDLESKLVGANAAVIVYPLSTEPARGAGSAATLSRLAKVPGVVGVEEVAFAQGVLAGAKGEREVTLRGVDPAPDGNGVAPSGAPTRLLSASAAMLAPGGDGVEGIVLGDELARELAAKPGDPLRLTALGLVDGRARFAFRTLRVAGTFSTGFAEFDQSWVVARRSLVTAIAGEAAPTWELRLTDPSLASETADRVRDLLGERFLVTDWQHMNRELFAALRLQQIGLFLLLGLIVLVATFNVASTLVVLTRERIRDLGLLAALGLAPNALARVLLLCGLFLGGAGIAAGLAIAAALSWFLTRFEIVRFGPDIAAIYFLRAVPFRLSGADAAAIAGFTLAVTIVASLAPARRATRIDPATALRYE